MQTLSKTSTAVALQTIVFGLLILAFLISTAVGQEANESFRDEIAPIFQRHCLECHNDELLESDLSFQSLDAARLGELIDTENLADSYLLKLITPNASGRAEMPKGRPTMSTPEREAIIKWVQAGASWPADMRVEMKPLIDTRW